MKYYYFVISLFVISISILYKTIEAAIHRTSSIGKTKAINRTRKPQSKMQIKKPEPSKAEKKNVHNEKNESKKDHDENKKHEINKKETHANKSDSNKKEMTNENKESHPQANNNIIQKEDAAKTQTNMIQHPIQNNNVPAASAPQVENKENSGIFNGIVSSIGGNVVGNAISDKLFKNDKTHEKNDNVHETHDFGKEYDESRHQRQLGSPNNKKEYDYYSFAVQNKLLSCMLNKNKNINCKNLDSVKWTIHGLWPNCLKGNHPSYCSNKENNPDFFSKRLKEDLDKYWPSLVSNNNKDFWNYEWKKHGTCANFTEFNTNLKFTNMDDNALYFEKSLEIYNKIKISDLFYHKNYYNSFDDLSKTIKNRLKTNNFDSLCYYDKREKKQYIRELRFKFEKNWELSNNESLQQDSNCYKSQPVYVYPERVMKENSSTHASGDYFYLCLLLITSLFLI